MYHMQIVWQKSIKKNNFAESPTAGFNNSIFSVASALSITQGHRVDYRLKFTGMELPTWLKVIEHFFKKMCVCVYVCMCMYYLYNTYIQYI